MIDLISPSYRPPAANKLAVAMPASIFGPTPFPGCGPNAGLVGGRAHHGARARRWSAGCYRDAVRPVGGPDHGERGRAEQAIEMADRHPGRPSPGDEHDDHGDGHYAGRQPTHCPEWPRQDEVAHHLRL